MSDFKPTERTLVTESRTFLVDKHSRSPLNRANQSAYLGMNEFTVTDVTVTNSKHFTARVSKHLTLSCPSPVILSFTSTGPVSPTEPETIDYDDAVITASDFMIGEPLVVSIEDDTPLSHVTAVIFNLTTGETESITLNKQNDKFVGAINTELTGDPTSFDSILRPSDGNVISIMYVDHRSATGKPKQIKATVVANSPYSNAELSVPHVVQLNSPLGVMVRDHDLVAASSVDITYEIDSVETTLTLLRADRPYGQVYVGTLDISSMGLPIGTDIKFSYNDSTSANGLPSVITNQTTIVGIAPITGEVILPEFNKFGDYFLQLVDFDIYGSVQLIALNERTQSFIVVTCNETVLGSGKFIGELSLTDTPVNGKLFVQSGDSIRVTYVDQNASSGTSELVSATRVFTQALTETPPVEQPVIFVPGTIDMQVDGLFTLYGNFVGTITVKGISSTPVRCNLVIA